jgi:hypothetical protein
MGAFENTCMLSGRRARGRRKVGLSIDGNFCYLSSWRAQSKAFMPESLSATATTLIRPHSPNAFTPRSRLRESDRAIDPHRPPLPGLKCEMEYTDPTLFFDLCQSPPAVAIRLTSTASTTRTKKIAVFSRSHSKQDTCITRPIF